MKQALTLLSSTIHQLQKERGLTVLYAGSHGKQGCKKIEQQFIDSDKTIAALTEAFGRWQQQGQIKTLGKLDFCLKQMAKLPTQRAITLSHNGTSNEAIHFYTYEVIVPLMEIVIDIALFNPDNNSNHVSAYNNFMQWKERTGRERALGTLGFLKHTFNDPDYTQHLKNLITEQSTYQQTFFALATPEQQACFNNTMLVSTTSPVDAIHKAIEEQQLESITAEHWQALMTNKIDMMHQVERLLIDTLANPLHNTEKTSADEPSNIGSKNVNDKHKSFIRTLPFFANLTETELSKLLQIAQIRKYVKGQILFLENEPATRLYIILSGWVKLYKGNVEGDEAILQMLSSGDSIAEAAVYLDTPYPLNAQVAENVVLLSIPTPTIRQLIWTNNKFAASMLNNLSHRSLTVIHQIETTRLKSAIDRVGWFLLKTLLSNHNKTPFNTVHLPYDKAIIASYLDMKPETFSRILKRFKEQDFRIENNNITLPDINALCTYCDFDTANICRFNNTNSCRNHN